MTTPPETLWDLFDFSGPGAARAWRSVDDVVMGGLSASRFVVDENDRGIFTGTVSLRNNGGFASVRVAATLPSEATMECITLEVRGDGKIYKLNLRTDRSLDGAGWQTSFGTVADTWTTVTLPLRDFLPRWRGRLIRDAPPFDPAGLQSIGLSIADKQEGPFWLEIRRLTAGLCA